MGRQERLPVRGILYFSLIGGTGASIFVITLANSLIIILLFTTIIGFLMTSFMIIWESLLQDFIDNEKLGRITSLDMFGGLALLPIGYWIFGELIENINASTVIQITGIGIILRHCYLNQ